MCSLSSEEVRVVVSKRILALALGGGGALGKEPVKESGLTAAWESHRRSSV